MQRHSWLDKDVLIGLAGGVVLGLLMVFAWLWWSGRDVVVEVAEAGPVATAPVAVTPSTSASASAPAMQSLQLDLAGAQLSSEALRVTRWVVSSADHDGKPFVILDKRQASVYVFQPDGRLIAATPVLLGYAEGDDTVPGIGNRPIEAVRPEERTTPAGRFVSEPGRNLRGEDVIWVDYDAAVSMHRVLLNNPAERRAERLASATADDNRISYGCINLPVAFFEQVLWPTLRRQPGIVYVLPEHKPLESVFPGIGKDTAAPAARS